MPSGKREAASMAYLSALAAGQPAEIRERRAAAESTLAAVRSRLGAPGTYDLPAGILGTRAAGTTAERGLLGYYGQEKVGAAAPGWEAARGQVHLRQAGIFDVDPVTGEAATHIDPRYTSKEMIQKVMKLKPGEYTKALEQSTEFRIVSRLMAESEQMLARQGPLWDEMVKNTQLPILEGSAAMARQNAEELRRAMARGGTARRNAFEAVQRIRSQERINSERVQQLADSRLKLDRWARDNARVNVEFANNWSANLAGVREEFNSAMDQASALMLSSALPIMVGTTQQAGALRYAAHQKNREKTTRWIKGIVGVAGMALGLGGAGFLGGGMASLAGGLGISGPAAGTVTQWGLGTTLEATGLLGGQGGGYIT